MRVSEMNRVTKETKIYISIDLDGSGQADIRTGIGFLDHMLELFAFHSQFDLVVKCEGDLDVDDHHTVEDCGIVLGQVFNQALKDRIGIARYGNCRLPMDESLAQVDLDLSKRSYCVFRCDFNRPSIGMLSTEMIKEFFIAFANNSGTTLHMNLIYGDNDHHKAEALFKGFARALKQATRIESDALPSTKGIL